MRPDIEGGGPRVPRKFREICVGSMAERHGGMKHQWQRNEMTSWIARFNGSALAVEESPQNGLPRRAALFDFRAYAR